MSVSVSVSVSRFSEALVMCALLVNTVILIVTFVIFIMLCYVVVLSYAIVVLCPCFVRTLMAACAVGRLSTVGMPSIACIIMIQHIIPCQDTTSHHTTSRHDTHHIASHHNTTHKKEHGEMHRRCRVNMVI